MRNILDEFVEKI